MMSGNVLNASMGRAVDSAHEEAARPLDAA